MEMTYSKKTITVSLCAALCIVLPQTLRVIPNAGVVYMAMYMPVLLCGIVCGPGSGFLCAAAGACSGFAITGAPAVTTFPAVLLELSLMGVISGFTMKALTHLPRGKAVVYSLAPAVLIARTAAGALLAVLFSPGSASLVLWIWAYLMAALPSFVVQLVLLPSIIRALEYSGFLSGAKESRDEMHQCCENTELAAASEEKS